MSVASEVESAASAPLRYFAHDSDANQDLKIQMLLDDHGMCGYGMWWRLVELLASTDSHKLEIDDPRVRRIVTRKLMLGDEDALMAFLKDLKDYGLIEMPGDGFLSSKRMDRNAMAYGKQVAHGRVGGKREGIAHAVD